ncbi:MAG: hypothetical protein Q9179_007161 [Wetmoreana sp. 5 TL-2023]
MSTRKRRISPNQVAEHRRSKRAQLISALWQPQGESDSSHRSNPSQESIYTIKAIIGEKPGEYLIDWADNTRTGDAYSPNWKYGELKFSTSNRKGTSAGRPLPVGKTARPQESQGSQEDVNGEGVPAAVL